MKTWTDWEVVRHHVSICGRVLDENRNPVAGIQLSAVPDSGSSQVKSDPRAGRARRGRGEAPSDVPQVLKQTESRPDGTFFFMDCAEGAYILTALDSRSGAAAKKTISVTEDARRKSVKNRGIEEGYQIELIVGK